MTATALYLVGLATFGFVALGSLIVPVLRGFRPESVRSFRHTGYAYGAFALVCAFCAYRS